MKVEVNRNDEMPKAGDLVIDELGNIGILMHNGYIDEQLNTTWYKE